MIKVKNSLVISKGPEEVFKVIADPTQDPKWHFDVVEAAAEQSSNGARVAAVGSKYKWVFDYMGMGRSDATAEVKVFEAGKRLEIHSVAGPLTQLIGYEVAQEAEGATRITRTLELEAGMSPEMEDQMKPNMEGRGHMYLLALKKLVEEGIPAPAWSNASCSCGV